MNSTTTFVDSKNHYQILDGLRGVAAVTVVIFHIFEAFSGGDHTKQIINHGYLAVDFFFVLSGFVIGYAYDDRWNKMTLGDFFKRRLIRLHPMIIIAMIVGAATFYLQDSSLFPDIHTVPVWRVLLVMLIGFTLIPLPISMDIKGWQEMYPLNGPGWTLFFEYIANILYALVIRRFSKTVLAICAVIAAAALIHLGVTHGDVVGGWSLSAEQLYIGFSRLMYPFLAGLLLSRTVKPGQLKHSFLWCSLLLLAVLAMPRVGVAQGVWANGLYDSLCIIFIFPLIVYMGASGTLSGASTRVSKFLGDISYPIYITHYPFIYIFTGWVVDSKPTPSQAWPVGLLVLGGSILLAYLCVKFYDIPVRRWLMAKYASSKKKTI